MPSGAAGPLMTNSDTGGSIGLGSRFGLPQAVDCLTSLGEYMRRRELIRFLGGAVAVLPLASRAQQTTIPRIGVLQFAGPEHMGPFAQALRDRKPRQPTFETAVELHRLVDAIKQASDTGWEVTFE